jgi:hypothetical protein
MRASCSDGIERSVCPLHRLAKEFPIEADPRAPLVAELPLAADENR